MMQSERPNPIPEPTRRDAVDQQAQDLAVDLGGTKALLGLFACGGDDAPRALHERRMACDDFGGFDALLAAYLDGARAQGVLGRIGSVCVALAGPVDGARARLTNRPWDIDTARIGAMLPGARVRLVNDFAAAAAGIEALGSVDLRVVQQATVREDAPRLVVGAGTGLGTALLVRVGVGWRVLPGEGGHAAFAPSDEGELGLWRHLAERHGRVAWESVVSGSGIEDLYAYLRDPQAERRASRDATSSPSAARIAEAGLAYVEGPGNSLGSGEGALPAIDPVVASSALDIFAAAFGAFAGDAALLALPFGGVFIAGGIAPKVFDARRTRLFLERFRAKGAQSRLMHGFPVHLVRETRVGLLGAALLAARGDPGVARQ